MNNQNGFVLPLTIVLLFIISSYLLFNINQYFYEKQIYFERNEVLISDELLQLAIVDIKELLLEAEDIQKFGKFTYDFGEVDYEISVVANAVKSIILKSKTLNDYNRQIKYYYYSDERIVLPWFEERVQIVE